MANALGLLPLLAACALCGCGVLVLWANPRRLMNQAAFCLLVHATIWLVFRGIHGAGQWQYRLTISWGAWVAAMQWLYLESTVTRNWNQLWRRCRWVFLATLPISGLPWLESFVPAHSTREHPIFGPAYYVHFGCIISLMGGTCVAAFRKMLRARGLARIELQLVALTLCIAGLMIQARMFVPMLWPGIELNELPFLVMLGYAGLLAWTCSAYKIFDAQYLFRVAVREITLVAVVTASCYFVYRVGAGWARSWMIFSVMGVVAVGLGYRLRQWIDRRLFRTPQAAAARAAAHAVPSQVSTEEDGARALEVIVAGWSKAERVTIALFGSGEEIVTADWTLPAGHPAAVALHEIGWATPERLERERSTPGRDALRVWLAEQGLGAVVVNRGRVVTLLIALGRRPSLRPFTYPEICELFELASIAEAGLVRLRLTEQAVQAEKLATVGMLGACLAHEIRNPLYSIRQFVEMLPDNHDKPEFRSRFIRMASAEVVRIDRMIAQLENLAAPRRPKARTVRLHNVVRGAIELVTPMADTEKTAIEIALNAEDDRVFADAAASKQVLLNLCLNAIQIQYQAPGRRWVRVATREVDGGVDLVVSDGGPGISPQVRARLFRAFQSARPGGLGLGLSISRDILAGFGARIDCDLPGPPGEGAIFRVHFRRTKAVAGLPAPAEQLESLAQRKTIDWRPAPPCVVSEE